MPNQAQELAVAKADAAREARSDMGDLVKATADELRNWVRTELTQISENIVLLGAQDSNSPCQPDKVQLGLFFKE